MTLLQETPPQYEHPERRLTEIVPGASPGACSRTSPVPTTSRSG